MQDLDCVQRLRFTRPLLSFQGVLCVCPLSKACVDSTDSVLTGEIRNARLVLPAQPESASVFPDPATQIASPSAPLLALIGSKAQLTPAFMQGSAPEIAAFTWAIDVAQIPQAHSARWLLLHPRTKEKGLSSLHTTTGDSVVLL